MNEYPLKPSNRVNSDRITSVESLVFIIRQRGFPAWLEKERDGAYAGIQFLFTTASRADLLKIRHAVRWLM